MFFLAGAMVIYLPSLIELQELRAKREALREETKRLKSENSSLMRQKELLQHDLGYVEKVARKKMGVVRKGEIPYKVVVEESPQ